MEALQVVIEALHWYIISRPGKPVPTEIVVTWGMDSELDLIGLVAPVKF